MGTTRILCIGAILSGVLSTATALEPQTASPIWQVQYGPNEDSSTSAISAASIIGLDFDGDVAGVEYPKETFKNCVVSDSSAGFVNVRYVYRLGFLSGSTGELLWQTEFFNI